MESYEDLQINFVDNHLSPFLNKHVDRISVGVNGSKTDSTFYDNLIGLDYATFDKNTTEQSYKELQKSREFANLLLELMQHFATNLPAGAQTIYATQNEIQVDMSKPKLLSIACSLQPIACSPLQETL